MLTFLNNNFQNEWVTRQSTFCPPRSPYLALQYFFLLRPTEICYLMVMSQKHSKTKVKYQNAVLLPCEGQMSQGWRMVYQASSYSTCWQWPFWEDCKPRSVIYSFVILRGNSRLYLPVASFIAITLSTRPIANTRDTTEKESHKWVLPDKVMTRCCTKNSPT